MRIAAKGKYWIRINNHTANKTMIASYDGFDTLAEAKEECDRYKVALLPRKNGDPVYSVMVEDANNNIVYPEV